ncbi:MAG TPA: alpha/beta fold hydrolase [Candidatus Acidoferrales bacterium]|nr:alpha/beta fold hydrolase [Candidatus Acidoferrales bacterium]
MKHAMFGLVGLAVLASLISGAIGERLGPWILKPMRKPLDPVLIAKADAIFARDGVARAEFDVRAPDGVMLRGWKVRAKTPNDDWVLLFHGIVDNRAEMAAYADFLLRAGYGTVLMDAREQGASDGTLATFGWKERWDTKAIIDALHASEEPRNVFELGESMGGAIALQSAAIDPRIRAVVAEASFSSLREVSYDYAGLDVSSLLGKTLFRPASYLALRSAEEEGSFHASDVSPEQAVAERAFPVLLICGTSDRIIPCRHSQKILSAAIGPKQLWIVPGAGHTGAFGTAPAEFERRVLAFFAKNQN